MRIAAGVLLIIASLFSGCEGVTYTFVGGAAKMTSDAVQEEAKKQGADLSVEGTEVAEAVSSGGGLMIIYGIFMLIMLGLQIGAGVVLFTQKAKGFVVIVAALSVIAGVLSFIALMSLWGSFAFSLSGVISIIAAIFAFIGVKSYEQAAA